MPVLRRDGLAGQTDNPLDDVSKVLICQRRTSEHDGVAPVDAVEVGAQLVDHDPVVRLRRGGPGRPWDGGRLDPIGPEQDQTQEDRADQQSTQHNRHPLDYLAMAMLL
jgi:hypothetical protein